METANERLTMTESNCREIDQVNRHLIVCKRLNELYRAKNHDYGDSFHETYMEDGLLMAKVRIGDKYRRFARLVSSDNRVQDESIKDTLLDLANYAIMTVMELEDSNHA